VSRAGAYHAIAEALTLTAGVPQVGHGGAAMADAAADWAIIVRSELTQEPHWSPMPQRWRSRTVEAPLAMALLTSRSDFPRQMQMITSCSLWL
jgi:hypothetical protein